MANDAGFGKTRDNDKPFSSVKAYHVILFYWLVSATIKSPCFVMVGMVDDCENLINHHEPSSMTINHHQLESLTITGTNPTTLPFQICVTSASLRYLDAVLCDQIII